MILWISLGFSIFNLCIWILVGFGIRKLFKRMYPMIQNLTQFPIYGKMSVPDIEGEINSEN